MDSDASFGQLLRRLRRAHDLTQEALAQQAYCAVDTIKKIEAGVRRPSRQLAAQFADCLGLAGEERAAFLAAARAGATGAADTPAGTVAPIGGTPAPAPASHRAHLPAQPTALLGRANEVAAVCALLRQADVRLLTLSGPGGVGKTRVALQAAADVLDDFASGAAFVALTPISDPGLVIATIAHTLGVREAGGQPLIETLIAALQGRQMLLLLDNFEQVVAAAPQIADLLAACPQLNVLVTSRVPLHLRGEKEIPVPPLAMPDLQQLPTLDHLTQYAAVDLFLQRVRDVQPSFVVTDENARTVAEICARLDGLPLAIELAATRSKLFGPRALLARLDRRLTLLTGGARDLPGRQQTIRATIDWSYELLDEGEQTLFTRLGVFVGGWTLEAAAAVCNADDDLPWDVVDGLAALLDQSLLQHAHGLEGESRFMMLETIREYALERLAASGEEDTIQQRHADYYLAQAEAAEPELRGPRQGAWFKKLEAEHDNLRAALRWYSDRGAAEQLAQLAGVLFWFWASHGHVSEGRAWLEQALARSSGVPAPVRAKALLAASRMASWQGNYERAQELSTESLALYRGVGDPAGIASAFGVLGWAAYVHGDVARAKALLEEGLALCQEYADRQGMADALGSLGEILLHQGDAVAARARYEERLALCRELGDSGGIADALWGVGYVAQLQGDATHATPLLEESLTMYRELGNKAGSSDALVGLGHVASIEGDYQLAAARYEASLTLRQEQGDRRGSSVMLTNVGFAALAQGDIARATRRLMEGLALSRALAYTEGIAQNLQTLGCVAGAAEQPERAARLWGAAEALREASGIQLEIVDRIGYDRVAPAVRAELGEDAFTAAWAAGRALSLEQAIADALGTAIEAQR